MKGSFWLLAVAFGQKRIIDGRDKIDIVQRGSERGSASRRRARTPVASESGFVAK
jgi:hypothetical protein